MHNAIAFRSIFVQLFFKTDSEIQCGDGFMVLFSNNWKVWPRRPLIVPIDRCEISVMLTLAKLSKVHVERIKTMLIGRFRANPCCVTTVCSLMPFSNHSSRMLFESEHVHLKSKIYNHLLHNHLAKTKLCHKMRYLLKWPRNRHCVQFGMWRRVFLRESLMRMDLLYDLQFASTR